MKYFNLLDWAMKYQKKFRELGRGLWESGNTAETVCLLSNTQSKKKESYITLDVEMADYYRIKNEGKNSTT